jgi:hypothetical protein
MAIRMGDKMEKKELGRGEAKEGQINIIPSGESKVLYRTFGPREKCLKHSKASRIGSNFIQ